MKSAALTVIFHCYLIMQVEMVYSLLSMLGTNNKDDMSRTLLAMSSSQDSCVSMRRSGMEIINRGSLCADVPSPL